MEAIVWPIRNMSSRPKILYCHCNYAKVVPPETKKEVLARLVESGEAFEAVADLCEMSARRDPALGRLSQKGPIKIAACFPRAVKWLFAGAGFPLPQDGTEVVNMRELDGPQACQSLFDPALTPNLPTREDSNPPKPSTPE